MKQIALFGSAYHRSALGNLTIIVPLIMLAYVSFYLLLIQNVTANQVAGYAFYLFIIPILWKLNQNVFYNKIHEYQRNYEIEFR